MHVILHFWHKRQRHCLRNECVCFRMWSNIMLQKICWCADVLRVRERRVTERAGSEVSGVSGIFSGFMASEGSRNDTRVTTPLDWVCSLHHVWPDLCNSCVPIQRKDTIATTLSHFKISFNSLPLPSETKAPKLVVPSMSNFSLTVKAGDSKWHRVKSSIGQTVDQAFIDCAPPKPRCSEYM